MCMHENSFISKLLRITDRRRSAETSSRTRVTLGRNETDGSSIRISDDPSVSRVHAQLSVDDKGQLILTDTSKNGTFINGQRVIDTAPLNHGDRIEMGEAEAVVLYGKDGQVNVRTQYGFFETGLRATATERRTRTAATENQGTGLKERLSPRIKQILLEMHRQLQSGLDDEEVVEWCKGYRFSTSEARQMLSQAKKTEFVRDSVLSEYTFEEPIECGGHMLQIADRYFAIGSRDYVPIILDGWFKLVYLSESRRVFLELRVATRTESSLSWHVKTEIEEVHDMPPEVDYAIKSALSDMTEQPITQVNQKVHLFRSLGLYRNDQSQAVDEASRELYALQDENRIIQLETFPRFSQPPEAVVVCPEKNIVEFQYHHTVQHGGKAVTLLVRVTVALNSRGEPFINVTSFHDTYYAIGLPKEKTFRGRAMPLTNEAAEHLAEINDEIGYETRQRESGPFFAHFRQQKAYQQAVDFLLGRTSRYRPVATERVRVI